MESISNEMLIGLAGEHLVCFDIARQGYPVFVAGEGLPYDIIVHTPDGLKRGQVKTSTKLSHYPPKVLHSYMFGTRKGKFARKRIDIGNFDFFALVALDIQKIAYLPIKEMITKNNTIKMGVNFRTRSVDYPRRVYSNGTVKKDTCKYYIEDYGKFRY